MIQKLIDESIAKTQEERKNRVSSGKFHHLKWDTALEDSIGIARENPKPTHQTQEH